MLTRQGGTDFCSATLLGVSLAKTAPPFRVLPRYMAWGILGSMLDQQKISMGRVRQAYGLNNNEVESVIQALWPQSVFPVELWRRTHEAYWQAFADSNQSVYGIESPALPEVDTTKNFFHTYLCSVDIMTFFRKLSLNIKSNILREGLKYILEECYENIDTIFPEEREFLFNTLSRLENVGIFDQYSPESELFEEKILSLPASSYHFISYIFYDTVLVDKVAVIRHLRNYPLVREVKGITRALVESILNSYPEEISTEAEIIVSPAEQKAEAAFQNPQRAIPVRRSLWEGKTKEAIRANMRKEEHADEVIARVLLYERGLKLTQRELGRFLGAPHKSESRYDQIGKELAQKAALVSITDAPEA